MGSTKGVKCTRVIEIVYYACAVIQPPPTTTSPS
jgi:hypothetical protein